MSAPATAKQAKATSEKDGFAGPARATDQTRQDERLPKNGLFGSATGSGLLSIRWIRLAVSTERASLATSLSAFRKIRW